MSAPRIEIPILEGDDVRFIHLARTALSDEVKIASRELYLVKIDPHTSLHEALPRKMKTPANRAVVCRIVFTAA